MVTPAIRVRRAAEKRGLIDDLAAQQGGAVGLDAVLGDLNRAARSCRVPSPAAVTGFAWRDDDVRSERWWPQGITTSAEAYDAEDLDGRKVILVSWYAHKTSGDTRGTRISVVDVTDPKRPRYRHVLLVEPTHSRLGRLTYRAVPVHAGGIVWYGNYLYVAGTANGIRVFDLRDVVRVPDGGERGDIGVSMRGRWSAYGYRYVLPELFVYAAEADEGIERMRYSFLSLDRSGDAHELIAGEYGRSGATTRLARYEIDRESGLLVHHDEVAAPVEFREDGVEGMQGATVVRGVWYITTSSGRFRRGDLWIRRPDEDIVRRRGVLTIGPEDITYWPRTDQLWSLSEYPGRRFVYGMRRERFDAAPRSLLSGLAKRLPGRSSR